MAKEVFIYGYHTVINKIKNNPNEINKLFFTDLALKKIKKEIQFFPDDLKFEIIKKSKIDKITNFRNHQGCLAKIIKKRILSGINEFVEQTDKPNLFLILDNIQDPQNLGSCFRLAHAFNVSAIVTSKRKSVSITATVEKIASGSVDFVPFFQIGNMVDCINFLKKKNIWTVGLDMQGKKEISNIDFKTDVAIIFGSEGKGLRNLIKEKCDELAKIKINKSLNSLNLSTSVAISLYEISKQRNV